MTCTHQNFIKRLQQRKEDAIEFVIDEYMPLVKAIVHKILKPLGKVDLVEDCMNDVFLSVWQHSQQFDGDAIEFKRWIGTIAKYKAIDQYRLLEKRQGREQAIPDAYEWKDEKTIQDQVLQREEKNELLFALSKLEVIDREIFMMKYFLEMPNGEIAEILQVSKASVDNRLYRGKKKLASLLKLNVQERWT
ncbi:sigma-70 family RNA polymerase sigma factor [Brevibacillus sp. 179-C9.3 HS]|uniref:sigma-70 family RNA polymerase sigma factor n=1 Tax=unclassified Brevibacillus TaxID=2684853 RepID=UPI00399F98D4